MILYDADWAPNPRRVRIVIAEKGLTIERRLIDLRAREQLGEAYLLINPRATVPALRLDDGTLLDDSLAIARYLDAIHPEPPLFGRSPMEAALVDSWTRRIEADGFSAVAHALRNSNPAFADRALPGTRQLPQIPALAERGRAMWDGFVADLDGALATREWVADGAFSFADVTALVTIDFARAVKFGVPDELAHVARWLEAVRARPSVSA